jgi:hypothetical protein
MASALAAADMETRPFDVGTCLCTACHRDSNDGFPTRRLRLVEKRGQEPIVRNTLRTIWLLVPAPFFKPIHSKTGNSSVIPFIGDQTLRVLKKLTLTVNSKLCKASALLANRVANWMSEGCTRRCRVRSHGILCHNHLHQRKASLEYSAKPFAKRREKNFLPTS